MNSTTISRSTFQVFILVLLAASLICPVYAAADPGSKEKIDLNRAGVQELATLPGIGKTRAEAIVQKRTEIGGFSTVDDLLKVVGIGRRILEKIDDRVFIGSQQ